jgi:hypothetical protein
MCSWPDLSTPQREVSSSTTWRPIVTASPRRYSPASVIAVERQAVIGEPEQISTSYVERQNLTLRMSSKRFARLSNGFSKKLEPHLTAVQ